MKHKETVKLLSNFINNSLSRVSNEGKVGLPLMQAYDEHVLKKQLKNSLIPALDVKKKDDPLVFVNDSSSEEG